MIKNYLIIAWRNLWKHKTFTVIIVCGMAIAFTAALLLSLTAYHELSYDQFHTNKANLYQLYIEQHRSTEIEKGSTMPAPFTPALKQDYSDIARITRYGSSGAGMVRYKDKEININARAVDPDFMHMFSFPIVAGNRQNPLKGLNDVVLTERAAQKIFNETDVTGKTLEMKMGNEWKGFVVSAVTKDFPENSSITFDLLTRFENFPDYQQNKDRWDASNHEVFVQLHAGITQARFEQRIRTFSHKYLKGNIDELKRDGAKPDAQGEYIRIRTIPFTDLHFNEISGTGAGINRFYPWLLLIISGFILFIACVNFVNLSLARSFTRAKEIGIRKVMGALRWQLVGQFWGEAFIVSMLALLLGSCLAWLLLPHYKTMFNQAISAQVFASPIIWIYILAGFMLITLFAGGYPAWIVSAFNTIQTVKGKLTTGKKHYLRNTLMVVQFVLSSLLIICTFIAWQQINYLRNKPLGYNKQQVISIPIGNNIDGEKALQLLRNRLAAEPRVIAITASDMNLGRGRDGSSKTSIIGFDYKEKAIQTNWLRVDYDMLKTLDIPLLSGRDFSRQYGMDTAGVLINEQMAKQMGDKQPVGQFLDLDGTKLQVVGVVKDFHFKSLHREIAPLTMSIRLDWPISYIFVRLQPGNLPASVAMLEKAWSAINPKGTWDGSFLDENTDRQYKKETRLSKIFMSGAALAILISCMGLFAIVLLVIVQRTKEIGIRKVLGAGVPHIVALVSKDFLKLVLLAIVIAAPIAWYTMSKWLENYPYRITIAWWVFVVAGLAAILIAFITLSFQTIKAALSNPVKSLRSE
jgi:putative ABC transport system permease protein